MQDMIFELDQKVKITPLDNCEGIIRAIYIARTGVTYEVRYFQDGKAENVYFYDDELEDINVRP